MEIEDIKTLRISYGLTQKDMAKIIECSTNSYIQKEKGRVDFTKGEMRTFKIYFNLTLSQFWVIFFENKLNDNEIK